MTQSELNLSGGDSEQPAGAPGKSAMTDVGQSPAAQTNLTAVSTDGIIGHAELQDPQNRNARSSSARNLPVAGISMSEMRAGEEASMEQQSSRNREREKASLATKEQEMAIKTERSMSLDSQNSRTQKTYPQAEPMRGMFQKSSGSGTSRTSSGLHSASDRGMVMSGMSPKETSVISGGGQSISPNCGADSMSALKQGGETTLGEQLRDQGIQQVSSRNYNWMDCALKTAIKFIYSMNGHEFTGEDIRFACQWIPQPKHPNAYGALINTLVRRKIIVATGEYRKPKDKSSHARAIQVYKAAF